MITSLLTRVAKQVLGVYIRSSKLAESLKEYEVIKRVDLSDESKRYFNQRVTRPKKRKLSIAFIIHGMPRYSGGHTSILRLGTYLSECGHEVYYVSYIPQSISEMRANAEHNLKGYRGEIYGPEGLTEYEYDVGIATYWLSAYYLWNMDNVKYKAYFVQDYEPDFYPAGDIRIFVENTYRMNYHMISLGIWPKMKIEKELGISIDSITFPYEPNEYWPASNWRQKFVHKKHIKIAVYMKDAPKRGITFLLMALEELYRQARKRGYVLDIAFFGIDKRLRYPLSIPYRNLGRPSKDMIRKLYQESDLCIALSYTNISLVTLEMMACGCPVVEVYEGSFSTYFSQDCGILVKSYPEDFVKNVLWYIEKPEERMKIAENAMKSLRHRTWRRASQEFNQILLKGYNNER